MRTLPAVAFLVVALVLPGVAMAAMDRPTIELVGGLGSSASKWDEPYPHETYGNEAKTFRAQLALPVTERFTFLVGYRFQDVETGSLMPSNAIYVQRDRLSLGEVGFRIRL